jgi:hypothetical protein
MKHVAKSIRTFIGAKDFDQSRNFYTDLGFTETVLSSTMSLFRVTDTLAFYLQYAYVKDWIDNSMIFLEVEDLQYYYDELSQLALDSKYPTTRLSPIVNNDWGSECFLHDPSGVLWHFGKFKERS